MHRSLWGLAVVSLLAVSTASSAAPLPSGAAFVDPLLARGFESTERQVVILVLDPDQQENVVAGLAAQGIPYRHWDLLHQASAWVDESQMRQLAQTPGVTTVWRNEQMRPYLDQSAEYIGANFLWQDYDVRGIGTTIFIVDSGVDGTHPDVEYDNNLVENVVPTQANNPVVEGYQEGVPSSDADGHGTHVAGIAGGLAVGGGNNDPQAGKYRGIAYRSDLVGFQAGLPDENGEVRFQSDYVLESYQYALAKQDAFEYPIRVVTNSWGANGQWEPNNPITQATFELYKAGMVVVFAAGNEGAEGEGTLNKYCVAPWILCVGAGDYFDKRASFSSIGTDPDESSKPYDHPDILAPGAGIVAAKATRDSEGDPLTGIDMGANRAMYVSKSGTSMATPHVAGVAALLFEANPTLSPDQVYDVIIKSSKPLDAPVWEVGAGYVNALDAYKLAIKQEGDLTTFLDGKVKYGGDSTGDPDFARDPVSVGLGKGKARAVAGSDVSVEEFATDLVETQQGLVFIIGTAALFLVAFGRRRRRFVPARVV